MSEDTYLYTGSLNTGQKGKLIWGIPVTQIYGSSNFYTNKSKLTEPVFIKIKINHSLQFLKLKKNVYLRYVQTEKARRIYKMIARSLVQGGYIYI